MQYFGSLANGAASDTDGDGFHLAQEYRRDYNPTLVDTIVNGGISVRTTAVMPFINPGYVAYQEISNPLGFVNNQFVVATNTIRILPMSAPSARLSAINLAAGVSTAFGSRTLSVVRWAASR